VEKLGGWGSGASTTLRRAIMYVLDYTQVAISMNVSPLLHSLYP